MKSLTELEKEIQELVEWELTTMDYQSLQDYFYEEKVEYYIINPDSFNDMKIYMKECIDPSIIFYHDVEKKESK